MRIAALALALLLTPPAWSAERCTSALFTRPCKEVRVVTDPPGATVTFTDRWGDQQCAAPCSVRLRWGDETKMRVARAGRLVAVDAPTRVRWVMRGMWGEDALGLEPNPVILTLAPERRGFFHRLWALVFHSEPRPVVIPPAK